jgi:hypothetical protein
VGQIDTPLLDRLDITFFNQLIFDTPLLCDFIGRTETFKTPRGENIEISDNNVRVRLYWPDGNKGHHALSLEISCRPLDRQLSSLAQVFYSALSHLHIFEHLQIIGFRGHWKDGMGNAQWLEVLHPFTSAKDLILSRDLIPLVAPALEDLWGNGKEVLPALQNLFLSWPEPSNPSRKRLRTSALRLSCSNCCMVTLAAARGIEGYSHLGVSMIPSRSPRATHLARRLRSHRFAVLPSYDLCPVSPLDRHRALPPLPPLPPTRPRVRVLTTLGVLSILRFPFNPFSYF